MGVRAALPAALAALFLGAWVWAALARVTYPYELEWMEGGVLQHVERLRAGAPVYAAPSVEFAPFPYTPLYYHASAAVAGLNPGAFAPLRAVSILATLATFALVGALASRASGDAPRGQRSLAALLAAGLFAAAAEFTGAFGDLARVDALAWALALGGLFVAREARTARGAVCGAILAALAFHTKQSTALLSLAASFAVSARSVRLAVLHGAAALALGAGAFFAFDARSDGWFRFWTLDLLSGAPVHAPMWLGYWRETGLALGGAGAVVAAAALTGAWRPPLLRSVVPAVALVATGWIGKLHVGGHDNNYVPTALGAALLFGPAAAAWIRHPGARFAPVAAALALGLLAHDPRGRVPGSDQRRATEATLDALRALDGPVLAPDHGWLVARARGEASAHDGSDVAHGMVWIDLLQSRQKDIAQAFVDELRAVLEAQRFRSVVTSDRWDDMPGLLGNYGSAELLLPLADGAAAAPVSGAPRRPTWVYRARD
ncbi:MAG: hypothetical protein AAFZ87_01360 [Planctomycetota bacterium]